MPTTPFSNELIAKLKAATAWRFDSQLGPVFTPRFFCCDDPNSLGISDGKEPVAVLSLTPNPALVGDSVAFDGTDSYDPDGTVTDYAWTFASGTPASSAADSGNVSWAAAGEYEVTLIVTDGTGLKSTPARTVMVVREPAGGLFIGADDGVWYSNDGGQSWTARNTGLTAYDQIVNDLKIDPATQNLIDDSKSLWIATDGGIFASNDGGQNWTAKQPQSVSNTWGDSPAPTVDELAFTRLLFTATGRLFAIANWTNGDGAERSWLYFSDDAGAVRSDIDATVTWTEVDLEGGS